MRAVPIAGDGRVERDRRLSCHRHSGAREARARNPFLHRLYRPMDSGLVLRRFGMTVAKMVRGPMRWHRTPRCFFSKTRFLHANRKTTSLENALEYQPACKPGSVRHRPLARTIRDGHSSGTMFAHGLEQPTRTAGLTSPRGVIAQSEQPATPSLFGFAPGGVYHAGSVAGPAVRSYRTFSPLLPPRRERFVLCGTFPEVTLAGRYPAPYVKGARTFLPGGLSTSAGAAVRPTDGLGMGICDGFVKAISRSRRLANNLS